MVSIGLVDVLAMRLTPMASIFMAETFMMLYTGQHANQVDSLVFNTFEVGKCLIWDQVEL